MQLGSIGLVRRQVRRDPSNGGPRRIGRHSKEGPARCADLTDLLPATVPALRTQRRRGDVPCATANVLSFSPAEWSSDCNVGLDSVGRSAQLSRDFDGIGTGMRAAQMRVVWGRATCPTASCGSCSAAPAPRV